MPKLSDWGKRVVKKGGGDSKYIRESAWKEDGKLIFWLHPDSLLEDRETLMLPVPHVNDDDEKVVLWVRRFFQGEKDIASKFRAWLGEQDDIDEDAVVMKLRHGKERKAYTKGQLLGLKGYDYKGKLLHPRLQSVMCIVPHDDPAVKLVALPISAGKKVWKLITSQMDDLGIDEGNPQLNPYAIKVTYDKAGRGADMYDAHLTKVEITDEIKECFEEEAYDVEAECSVKGEDIGDFGSTAEILRNLCVVDCPLWDTEEVEPEPEDDEEEDDIPKDFGKKKKPAAKKPVTKKKTKPKPPPEPEPEEEEEPEDSDEDAEQDDDMIYPISAGEAEEGVEYTLEDDTVVTFLKIYRKRAQFEDEDGEIHKLALTDSVWPVESDGDDEEEEPEEDDTEETEGEEVQVRDCKVGSMYLDSDEDLVKFIEFSEGDDEGIFEDHEGDHIRYEGDDLMTPTGKKKA